MQKTSYSMDLEQQFENKSLNVDVLKISDSEQYHEKPKETPISQNANGKRKIDEDNTSKKKRDGRFTEDTIPEELTHIGNNVFVGPTLFNGKITVHIRQYNKYGSTYYPTRNGVNLEPSCLDTFSQHSPQEVFTMTLQLPKNFSAEYDGYHIALKQLTVNGVEKSNIRLTIAQREELSTNYSRISAIVTNLVYQCMDFCEAYESVSEEPINEKKLPESFDISLGTTCLQTILKTSLEQLIQEHGDLKYPKLIDCEELAIHKTETINSLALKLNSVDIARQFYANVWTEEPYLLLLKPAHYITKDFLKSVCLKDVLDEVKETFCPTNLENYGAYGIEYYECLESK